MNIHIATFGKVVIDDQDSGNVFAACRANPSAAADIEQRAIAYVSRLAESDARVTQLDRDTNAANTSLASLRKESEALTKENEELSAAASEIQSLKEDRDRLAVLLATASAAFDAGDIAALKAMRAAALQTKNEKKLAAALAKKAEAEAEIAELSE